MLRARIRGTVWTKLGYGDRWGDLCRAWAWAEVGSAEEQTRRQETFKAILHSPRYEHWTDLILTGSRLTVADVARIDACQIEEQSRFAREFEPGWIEFQSARAEARDAAISGRDEREQRRQTADQVPS